MSDSILNESIVEAAAIEWFGELSYAVGHGQHLAPGEPTAERNRSSAEMDEVNSFGEVLLVGRLREVIWRLPMAIPFHIIATKRDTRLPNRLSGEGSVQTSEEMVASVS